MAHQRPTDRAAEVNGQAVRFTVEGLSDCSEQAQARGREIIADTDFEDPQPGEWYSLAEWLWILDSLAAAVGDEALFELGTKVPEAVEWPTDVNSVTEGFATVNDAYHMNHRGDELGYYEFIDVGERERKVVCENPYPCPYDKGIIKGTLQAFGREFNYTPMVFIHETSDRCRSDGGTKCTYRVSW